MKINKIFKKLIIEEHNNTCIEMFGKYLFDKEMGGTEPNTKIEQNYADLIYQFSGEDYGPLISPEFIDAIYDLKSCMSTYPDILYPNNTEVYRGTLITLKNLLTIGIPDNNESIPYTYHAYSPIQSWTTSFKSASNFSSSENDIKTLRYTTDFDDIDDINLSNIKNFYKIKIPIIIGYESTEDDFLFNVNSFSKLSEFWSENEILRINNKPISTQLFINYNKIDNLGLKFLSKIKNLLEDID